MSEKADRLKTTKVAIKKYVVSKAMSGRAEQYAFLSSGELAVLLPGGHWIWNGGEPFPGSVEGFNSMAPRATNACRGLGLISTEMAEEFIDWYVRKSKEGYRQSELAQLKSRADTMGYKLVKK